MSDGHGHRAGVLSLAVAERLRCTRRSRVGRDAQLDVALAALGSEAPDPAWLTELVLRSLRNAGLATPREPPS